MRKSTPATDRQRRVTLADLARALDVSTATISNAYNRPDRLSAELRQRILDTAERLGYPGPNPAARGLRRGQAATIGVLYADRLSYAFADPGYVQFLHGVSMSAERAGLALSLIPGGPRRRRSAETITSIAVDGFIAYSMTSDDPLFTTAAGRREPLVVVDQPQLDGTAFVGIDDTAACRDAAAMLLRHGHRRLGVLSLELGLSTSGGRITDDALRSSTAPMVMARLQGYRDAVTHAGLSWDEHVTAYECPENMPDEGRMAAHALLTATPRPTALLAMSDQLALGALRAAADLGLTVPDELSVVGFDDVPDAQHANPALTTVRQPHADKGRMAADLLIARVTGDQHRTEHRLPTELVERATTAKAPAL